MKLKTEKKTIKIERVDTEWLWSIVGNRIKERREALGITQAQLSTRMDLSRTSIANMEAGRQFSPLQELYNYALILDCEVRDLIP